jgi:hypothetical protein
MRVFHKLKNHYHCPIINLDKLWTLVGEEVRPAQHLRLGGPQRTRGPAACAAGSAVRHRAGILCRPARRVAGWLRGCALGALFV